MKKVLMRSIALAVCGMKLGGCTGQGEQSPKEPRTSEPLSENTFLDQGTSDNASLDQGVSENRVQQKETSENESTEDKASEYEETGGSVPTIIVTNDRKEWYTDDGEQLLLEVSADRVEALGDDFDALNTAFAEQWSGLGDDYEELEWARDHFDSLEAETDYFMEYYINEGVCVYRLDDCVVSLCGMYESYTGGAHGYYGYDGATFDVRSGRKLQLEDLLNDVDGFYGKAVSYILEELEEMDDEDMLFANYKEVVETETFGETPACWYLDNTGIAIQYDLYSIAPYVAGAPGVTLPYDEFGIYMKEEYLPSHGSLFSRVEPNEDFSKLIGENGKVMLTSVYSDEYSDAEVTVVSGNASKVVGTFGRVESACVIRRDGRSFLVFCCDYASDDYVTYVYEVTGGKVQACDKLDGAAYSGTCMGTDQIGLSMHLDVLGTYTGNMVYHLADDGKLAQTEEIFAVNTSQRLTVIKELPVTMDGKETTLPVGSKIRITATDNAGKAWFELVTDAGKTGMIQYVRDDEQWQLLIDDVSENEYFEMVPYAG